MISGGMAYILPSVLKQLKEFDIDKNKISKIIILHAHFDHIGIIPYFKRSNPNVDIYASRRAWEILSKQKSLDTINEFNKKAAAWVGLDDTTNFYDLEWRDDITGISVSEDQVIRLGQIQINILEIPGHSSCAIAAYIPSLKALFPSDGGGIPFKDGIITAGNSNYTLFQQSLEKLQHLKVNFYCADHYGYISGNEAKLFVQKMVIKANETRSQMERIYRRSGSVTKAAQEMVRSFCSENPEYVLPPEINKAVHMQMIRHIADALYR